MTASLDVMVTDDLSGVDLRVGDTTVRLSTAQLEELQKHLANARMAAQPPVSDSPNEGENQAVANPKMYIAPNATQGAHALVIRHPAYGWLHFLLSIEGTVDLVNGLSAAVVPKPPQAQH